MPKYGNLEASKLKARAACPIDELLSCAGMPDEMQIVYHAVARRYAVLVVGPDLSGTNEFCYEKMWPPEGNSEVAGVRHLPLFIGRCLDRHISWPSRGRPGT